MHRHGVCEGELGLKRLAAYYHSVDIAFHITRVIETNGVSIVNCVT